MNKLNPPVEALQFLRNAHTFACFCRLWWDGAGMDAVAWWEDATGAHFRWIASTGEQIELKEPILGNRQSVSKEEVEWIIAQFTTVGLRELPSQDVKRIYTHFDDWFGLKAPDMDEPYWIKVCGGKHADPRGDALLDAVFACCPAIGPGGDKEAEPP